MDFISDLTHTFYGHDGIQVVVDCLTKSAHFIPIQMTFSAKGLA